MGEKKKKKNKNKTCIKTKQNSEVEVNHDRDCDFGRVKTWGLALTLVIGRSIRKEAGGENAWFGLGALSV